MEYLSTEPTTRKVVDLDAERRRRRPNPRKLDRWEVEAYSAAIRLAEPGSEDYWRIFGHYLRACGELV